jgi:hypothetical protein
MIGTRNESATSIVRFVYPQSLAADRMPLM